MKFPKVLLPYALASIVVLFCLIAMQPVKISRENSVAVKAMVNSVSEGGLKDIVISLSGVRGIHYINRGMEHGLTLASLRQKLVNKEVTVYYAKPGILAGLSPMTDTRHITELKLGDETIYSELN